MTTPIVDFVRQYAASGTARLHMPGHKGAAFLGVEHLDITEISGADDLFHPEDIIAESERNATALFGTGRTLYSTEGATLPIKAMLALAVQNAPKTTTRPRILAARNVHKSFLFGCALLDIEVEWLYPDTPSHLCSCAITQAQVRAALEKAGRPFCAVYLTSPDYLGNLADIAGIAAVCRQHGVPLLVDNAHGAYLAFSDPVCHPIALGATMCADSAHKTLPVLTGGAYLHIAKDAPTAFAEGAKNAMALFASTSPSYLILQSLDLCNEYLEKTLPATLKETSARVQGLRELLSAVGYTLHGDEPLKLTVDGLQKGYRGTELATQLRELAVEPELADEDLVVLMCTPQNTDEELARVAQALVELPQRTPIHRAPSAPTASPERVLTVREAILSAQEILPTAKALGRICATPAVSCPPAIPIVVSGERIDAHALSLFARYGIEEIAVVK